MPWSEAEAVAGEVEKPDQASPGCMHIAMEHNFSPESWRRHQRL